MKTLLIVDDLFTNRMLIAKLITQLGFKCIEANDGKKAIEKIKASSPDLIIMDIEMPIMNGIETTRYIREKLLMNKKSLPIFAVTAHDPEDLPKDFLDAGFNGMLSKPFTLDKFKALTENYL